MGLGAVQTGVAAAGAVASASGASVAAAAAGAAAVSAAVAGTATSSLSVAGAASTVTPSGVGPHPGTLDVYETVPGGATTEDPAMAYDTSSYEPILNVYGTLVEYNGTSTSSWVPDLATCVPGTAQCAANYGAGFTGEYDAAGHNDSSPATDPVQYYTFVIDPAAKFYDPTTHASWGVYPSDVMFSFARTMMFSEQPSIAKTAGWIDTQGLLPYTTPNGSWDNGTHPAWNNTPFDVYSSMYVNDSAFCPASAMGAKGHGCITFNADGQGQLWPEFMEFVTDPAGSAIVSCGYFTAEGAGIPGWAGTAAAHGDGSCKLPDGGTATNNSAWNAFLNSTLVGSYPYKWDAIELSNVNWPNTFPNVRWNMVGTGPYYAKITPGISYALAADPAYAQPSGCSGANGIAKYTDAYCNPAPGGFIPNVKVTWETAEEGDSLGIDAITAGTADFAAIEPAHTTTLKSLVAEGIWNYLDFPTTADAFIPLALSVNWGVYNSTFSPWSYPNPIPQNFTTDVALRNFLVHAYPYQTVDNTINTVDGLQFTNGSFGGPIPYNVSGDYAWNATFPFQECGSSVCNDTNVGVPSNDSSVVGNAGWWWHELSSPSGLYYNATIATKCVHGDPCTFPIGWFNGNSILNTEVDDWAAQVFDISNGAIEIVPTPISFTQYLATLGAPYSNPLIGATGFGWIMDYPDPSDWFVPISLSDGGYTAAQALGEQLNFGEPNGANNTTCGHSAVTLGDLSYWANAAQNPSSGTITDACQTVAYSVAANYIIIADALAQNPTRQLYMVLAQQVLNGLSIDLWQGQSNAIVGYAPWIDPASINQNPTIGAGGIGLFYQVQYTKAAYSVTVNEAGLPTGTNFTATVGGTTLSSTNGTIDFPQLPNGTYNFSIGYQPGYTVTPSNGSFTISGTNVTENVTYAAVVGPTVNLAFNETGLVSNTSWSLLVPGYGAQLTNAPGMSFAVPPNATYDYAAQPVIGYATPAPGAIAVGNASVSVPVPYVGTPVTTYPITFTESGLPLGSNWSVTLGPAGSAYTLNSTTSTITFWETNGSYPVQYTLPAGYVTTTTGWAVVSGQPLGVSVLCAPTAGAFAVTFTASGLATGKAWQVSILGLTLNTTGTTSVFELPNGTYNWSIEAIPGWVITNSSGQVTVNGSAVGVGVTFAQFTYAVTFYEGGLPASTSWTVKVTNATGTETFTSTTYYLVANLSNGSFNWSVSSIAGYAATPPTGSFVVNAAALTEVVIFSPIPATFQVTFTSTGLGATASWTVWFAGQEKTGTGPSSLTFTVANGSWTYALAASGYTLSSGSAGGTVAVVGAAQTLNFVFAPTSSPSTSSKPSDTYLSSLAYAVIGVLAVLVIIGFALAARGRRPPASPPETWTQGSTSQGSAAEGGTTPPDGPGSPPTK